MEGAPTDTATGRKRYLALLTLTALGVVFGDIGTSPLYAFRECFHGSHALGVSPVNVLGVLSLILWSLIVVVSIKYLIFILRADNRGEGGILALTALVVPVRAAAGRYRLLLLLGLFGAALLYGDGIITPAISVLSAIEGLEVATPFFTPYVIPITVVVLVLLFFFQHRGTAGVGKVFGPVIIVWFAVLAVLGVYRIVAAPHVLAAVNPLYAVRFFAHNGFRGFVVLGAVFLCATGAEALYADMGHFGKLPIRIGWFGMVLPALVINYFGQGALLLTDPSAAEHPFYHLAPAWALYPLVLLATLATVIASQAVISGAFSLTQQAVQLGYTPRLEIEHTSARERGQIYVPAVNWGLMLACIALVLGFGSSTRLAAAYGIAVTSTMVITTILFYAVERRRWKWRRWPALLLCAVFLSVDVSFFGANLLKIAHGGWFPLAVALLVFTLMSTWKTGRRILNDRLRRSTVPLRPFLQGLALEPVVRVPGVSVFMYSNPHGVPPALLHNLKHNRVLHETVIILTVETREIPRVDPKERLEVEPLDHGFYRVVLHYGFMEEPDVPVELKRLRLPGLELDPQHLSYFLSRETLLATSQPGMWIWRERLFAWMARNARPATSYFNLPPNRVVELGMQVEL
ncbi:MAG TPA: potassium transporter Kup [Thermoanaerobaculia bacterium]|jgi:KUP system potassium uptake protein|nr:potassium transporter Kup [Thermoanaerobaculia bacterium]